MELFRYFLKLVLIALVLYGAAFTPGWVGKAWPGPPVEPPFDEVIRTEASPTYGVFFVYQFPLKEWKFAHAVDQVKPAPECADVYSKGGRLFMVTRGASPKRWEVTPAPTAAFDESTGTLHPIDGKTWPK